MKVTNLTCDYMVDPIGFDFDRPGLAWRTESDARNGVQTAYPLQISEDGRFDALLLDTGRVESADSVGVRPGADG